MKYNFLIFFRFCEKEGREMPCNSDRYKVNLLFFFISSFWCGSVGICSYDRNGVFGILLSTLRVVLFNVLFIFVFYLV